MAVGLATGMGYVGIAAVFTIIISGIHWMMHMTKWYTGNETVRTLRITVPENLDYEGKFEDIFEQYLISYQYDEVKTSNMGSLYKLTLSVVPKANMSTKDFLDAIRTRNGNLDISLGRKIENTDSL